ncbi:MAG: type IX secretion system membrane protein PorP/SprF [Saprospiraceae bacterium]|nr:type IX secretion system membrane protein PorP/SprF [Candidatus Defluviibacterium haderslevense]
MLKIPTRYGFFANYEFIALSTRNSFISFKPLIVYEQQQNIHYFEIGNRFSINRNLGLGIYYHFNNQSKQGWNTNWFTINAELGKINSRHQRFDFGLSYSDNLTGVRNYLGAIVEISVAIHFASSPSCKLIGKGDKVPYSYDTKCPYNLFSLSKRKLYENIWFKTN